jgi:hypothetical protein
MVKGSRQFFSMPQMATVACPKYVATTGYNADPAKGVEFPPYPRIQHVRFSTGAAPINWCTRGP